MAEVRKPCSVVNAYNCKQDVKDTIGHVTKIKVGTKELTADQTVKKPTDLKDEKVVMVLCDFAWPGGAAEPVTFVGQVSAKNKQEIGLMLHQDLSNTEVVFQYKIYEYDPVAKKQFMCAHSNDTDMKGLVMKQGKDLLIQIADKASMEVVEPENFGFVIGIMPQRTEQSMHLATSDTGKFVKKWGVTVS